MVCLGFGGHVPLAPCTPHLAGRSGAGGRQRGTLYNRVQSRSPAALVYGLPCLCVFQPLPPRPSGQPCGSQQPYYGGCGHLSVCLLCPAKVTSDFASSPCWPREVWGPLASLTATSRASEPLNDQSLACHGRSYCCSPSKVRKQGVPFVAQWVTNPTSIYEDAGSIPGLAQ